jgi:hypothetical protein
MKRYLKYIFILMLIFVAIPTYLLGYVPYTYIGGTNAERAYALVQAADTCGFVLAGWTKSFGPGTPTNKNLLIVKTTNAGNPVWAKISIGENDEEIRSMVRTRDSGYALTGWTYSYQNAGAGANIIVIKLDVNGIKQWGYVYGGNSDDKAYSIIQDSDGNYVICGYTYSFGPMPTPNIIVMKLYPDGFPIWTKIYWNNLNLGLDEAYSITEAPSSLPYRYVVVGRANLNDTSNIDAFVLPITNNGNLIGPAWTIEGISDDEAYSVIAHNDTIVVAGWTNSFGPGTPGGPANIFVWSLVYGNPNAGFKKIYGWDNGDEKVMGDKALIKVRDIVNCGPGYVVAGWTTSKGPDIPNPNFLIIKLAYDGESWIYNGTNPWYSRIHPSISLLGSGLGLNDQAWAVIEAEGKFSNPWYSFGYVYAGWTDGSKLPLDGEDFHFFSSGPCGNLRECMTEDSLPKDIFVSDSCGFETLSTVPSRDTIPIIDCQVPVNQGCTLGIWVGIESNPELIASGGGLTMYNDSIIFGLAGNNTRLFMRYDLILPVWWYWDRVESVPLGLRHKKVKKGGCITNDGRYVYAFKGGGTNEFYQYDPSLNHWDSLPSPNFTKGIKGGFTTVVDIPGESLYLYAGSGNGNNEWKRFNISSGHWEACVPATLPADKFKIGSSMAVYDDTLLFLLRAGGKRNYFYCLNLNNPDSGWVQKESIPLKGISGKSKKVGEGASLISGSEVLYVTKGNNTLEFWKYNPDDDVWTQLEDMPLGTNKRGRPVKTKGGAGLAYSPRENYIYVTTGNKSKNFWLYNIEQGTSFRYHGSHNIESNTYTKAIGRLNVQNPSNGILKISYILSANIAVSVKIYNNLGRMIYEANNDKGTFEIKGLPAGTYFLSFEAPGYKTERKLVVVK